MSRALALDIGGTKIAAGIVELPEPVVTHRPPGPGAQRGLPGTVVTHRPVKPVVTHRRSVPTPAQEGGPAVLAAVTELAREVLLAAVADGSSVPVIGVASAGTVRPGDGHITHATGTLPGWAGTPLGEHLASVLGCPTTVLNDVHAHGLGEALFGAGVGHRSVLVVAVGTGVGGALVVDGQPMVGAHGVAGHVGHLHVPEAGGVPCTCGRVGHLEGFASGSGLRAVFRERTGQDLPTREIAALLTARADGAGDKAAATEIVVGTDLAEVAHTLLAEAGRATGRTIGALLNVLDPDVVVVGGGLAQAPEPWRSSLAQGVALEAMDPVAHTPLVFSDAGSDAALWGAAQVALQRAGLAPADHPSLESFPENAPDREDS